MVHGLDLKNTWKQNPARPAYTHHSPSGATRIDRLYVSQELMGKNLGIEMLPAGFTDHHAVILRLAVETPAVRGAEAGGK